MGLVDDIANGPGDLATFTGGDALPSPFSLITRAVYPVKIGGLKFPKTTYISGKARKNIVITEIPGGNGTVKEQISHPDYEFTIEGIYAEKNNKAVLQAFENLIFIWNERKSLPILCTLTDKIGVEKIALQGFEFGPEKGKPSVIRFKFDVISDNSIDLKKELRDGTFSKLRKLIGL
ncbi:MAG: hypothetical protein J0L53_07155 [Spirochaetes bacterium]|nr:hypothetical protein [Spirochaetota bacterium]